MRPRTDSQPRRLLSTRGHVLTDEDGPKLSTCLPRKAASVPMCRQLVRQTLTDWKLPELTNSAELVVAELAANAVRHARHDVFRLTVQPIADGGVRVAVIDKSRVMPTLHCAGEDDVTGRGLALVNAVAKQWGTDRLFFGKRVWADLTLDTCVAEHRRYSTRTAQLIYVLIVVTLAAWLGVLISAGQR
ncbi:ATP-binding protein [Streptomyces sp. NRRL S-1022]|uniref:ATP-binding protein n=1 Tax=Streptomyces sp. NRRL S-1022 TaxID=1463880 RepID=UPI0018FEB2F6|nr:ATP-binding protein [Streptomyces sp. NRRL S-1022]